MAVSKLTSRERFSRMFEHRDADRIPIIDSPWAGTIRRWESEGMPRMPFEEYFDIDRITYIGADNSPRYPEQTLEETEDWRLYTTAWGATLRSWKTMDSTPEFVDFTIKTHDDWTKAKARMQPSCDRINWDYLKENYPKWRKEGRWINGAFGFGFDISHSWIVGTERFLMAIATDPEWCVDMFHHELELHIALFDMIWNAGYTFDCIQWCDDMGYKHNQFFSLKTYRELLKPIHQMACDWAHSKGIRAHLHSCGDVNPLIPDLIEIGVDALNPLEVKAGMDPLALKAQYGERLVLHGGINAVLWDQPEAITAEMQRVVPVLKQNGGYIFSSDHSVPNTVSLSSFRMIIDLAKKLGSYE